MNTEQTSKNIFTYIKKLEWKYYYNDAQDLF